MLAISLLSHSLRSNRGIAWLVPGVRTSTCKRAFHSRIPFPLGQHSAICLFSHLNYNLKGTFQRTSLWLGVSPIDTSILDSSFSYRLLTYLALGHRFHCRATEPGLAKDACTIEIWFWLIDCVKTFNWLSTEYIVFIEIWGMCFNLLKYVRGTFRSYSSAGPHLAYSILGN